MRVEKQGVHTPRERLESSIQVLESRCRREFATILVLHMRDVSTVFSFHIVNPGKTNSNLKKVQLEQGSLTIRQNALVGKQT